MWRQNVLDLVVFAVVPHGEWMEFDNLISDVVIWSLVVVRFSFVVVGEMIRCVEEFIVIRNIPSNRLFHRR